MISKTRFWRGSGAVVLAAGLAGCASPGLPKPPSLGLPAAVANLAATRADDTVRLSFTAPSHATDQLPLKGAIAAVLCRQQSAGPCSAVLRRSVQPGEQVTLEDRLPAALAEGSPVLLTYRVTLENEKGRSAEASNEAYTVGGTTPAAVSGLTIGASSAGAVLRWQRMSGTDFVELERTRKATDGASGQAGRPRGVLGPRVEPDVVRLLAGELDSGGTVDAGAKFGESYTYVAWRVRRLTLAGHSVEIRSAQAGPVTVEMRDVFPPGVPRGLTAVATGEGIDLSWEPDTESDLAGYFVYRTGPQGGAERMNAVPVAGPAYHDATAAVGVRYRYAVSAVDQSGNESERSAEVEEGIQ